MSVERILYYVRGEQSEKDYLLRELSLEEVVHKVLVKYRDDLLAAKMELKVGNLAFKVVTDAKWLEFILGQIVSNSIKYIRDGVEHYIKAPIDEEYMYYTIVNAIRLLYTNRGISPLTGLPGNIQIQTEIKRRLLNKEDFCVIYLDLDNFKAYNDVYGFLNGDEIIKFTAKTIMNNINSNDCEDCFVGHIGGDDFVAMITGMNCEKICQNIVIEFDEGVKRFFTRTDLDKGYIEVPNRKGVIEQFPITSISIGVVVVDKGRFKNTLEIGEVAAQVKHLAKTTFGSTYVIDRRKK